MTEFADIGDEVIKVYQTPGRHVALTFDRTSMHYYFDAKTAREIAREILRLVGDDDETPKAPAPGLRIGDTFADEDLLLKITAIYTDGVDYYYMIAGRLLTSYDIIAQGYKRVTLVDDGGV